MSSAGGGENRKKRHKTTRNPDGKTKRCRAISRVTERETNCNMSKRNLVYIICAMSIALLGFISVQIYWTYQVFDLQEQVFKNTVHQAMNEVVFQTNRRDISDRVLHYKQNAELIHRIDTLNTYMAALRKRYPSVDFDDCAFCQNPSCQGSQTNFVLSDPPRLPDSLIDSRLSASQIRRLKNLYRTWEQDRTMLLLNSRLIDDLLRVTMRHTPEQSLLRRIDPYQLDTLIWRELNAKGIHTDFEWGIFSSDYSKLVVRRSKDYGVRLLQSPFYYRLFPNDPSPESYFIIVDFPQQTVFIASRMWYVGLVTLLLFALQLFAFAYTVRAVLRQHRFSTQKTDFINHITHEIKTPISTISLVCESFRDPDIHYGEDELRNLFDMVHHESKRLQQLSRQMIEISTLEDGFFQLERVECDLHEIIRQAITHSGFQIMLNRGRIQTDLQASNTQIFGDKQRLTSVFTNLIENANKYCERAPLIHISSRNTDSGIEITVADNGIGISKKQWHKVFEKLYRVPAGNTQKHYGFGLGLSFVKSITEQHKGKIRMESELKKGTTFHLFFPAEKKEATQA